MASGWGAYVTTLLESSTAMKRVAIIGLDGAVWARSDTAGSEFRGTDAELKKLVEQFQDLSSVPGTGVDLEGIHYIVPVIEENLLFGKKDKNGFVAAKIKSAILIGVFEGEAVAGSEARAAVEKLAKFLEDGGY